MNINVSGLHTFRDENAEKESPRTYTSASQRVQLITADAENLVRDICEGHSERLSSRGGHFKSDELIPVYFTALVGISNDRSDYNNLLYDLREDLNQTKKNLLLKNTPFENPTTAETADFIKIDRSSRENIIKGLCGCISVPCDKVRTEEVKSALEFLLRNDSRGDSQLFNLGIKLCSWFNRTIGYCPDSKSGFREIPVMIYYGDITPVQVDLLWLLSCAGFDVVYINQNKTCIDPLKAADRFSRFNIIELEDTSELIPYPDTRVQTKIKTLAYTAERELDEILYNSDTMFRDFQFSKAESQTMQTTYDEIDILWNQEIRFRPGFKVKNNVVTIPVIFAKISGMTDSNQNKFWDLVRSKLTPMTIYSANYIEDKNPDGFALGMLDPYHDGHRIFVEKFMNSRENKLGYLSQEIQEFIFGAVMRAHSNGSLNIPDDRQRLQLLMYAAMNLEKGVVHYLQKYDFTKHIPKYIVVDTIQKTFSLYQCVHLALMNALGFDILVFTPTGYRNLETFINQDAYGYYQLGHTQDNIKVPRLTIPTKWPSEKSGFFDNLFRKGR